MNVVIFFGHHKVGSTALQTFLSQNIVELLQSGILYPCVDFEGISVMTAKALGRDIDNDKLPINFREAHNALAFRMLRSEGGSKVPPYHKNLPSVQQMLNAIRKQIQYFEPHTILLTAEVFSHFAAIAPGAIKKLNHLFEEDNVRLMATLRRVDEYLISWHGQRLKFGNHVAPLRKEATARYFKSIHFDYQLMLDGWLKGMPDAEIVLRNYADVLVSGGANEDFLHHSGVDFPKRLIPGKRKNVSLHRALMEIARLGNHKLPSTGARELRRFLNQVTPKLELPKSGDIEMFGSHNRSLLAERFAPIHEYLGRISGTSPFFPDVELIGQSREIDELDAANSALTQLRRLGDQVPSPLVSDFLNSLELH